MPCCLRRDVSFVYMIFFLVKNRLKYHTCPTVIATQTNTQSKLSVVTLVFVASKADNSVFLY